MLILAIDLGKARSLACWSPATSTRSSPVDPWIEHVHAWSDLIRTAQGGRRLSLHGHTVEHEIDEKRETALLAGLTQRPDQSRGSAGEL